MLLPDITDLLYDEEVGGNQPFTIKRTTITYRKGRYSQSNTVTIQARGSVQPLGVNPLNQQPEGDRDDAVYIVRTRTAMQMGSSNEDGTTTLPDEIEYLGDRYKILSVKEWHAWGMYVANMTRIEPATAQVSVTPQTPVEPEQPDDDEEVADDDDTSD